MRSVWADVYCRIASQQEQDLFCPLCKRVGPQECTEEMEGRRIGRLRAYGNAIVPQVAEQFIRAFMECQP